MRGSPACTRAGTVTPTEPGVPGRAPGVPADASTETAPQSTSGMGPEPAATPVPPPGVDVGPGSPPGLAPEPEPAPVPAAATAPGSAPVAPELKLRHTRVSATWTAVVCAAVVAILLIIFILENGKTVEISYFGASGHMPLGVALLVAVVAGALLVGIIGIARLAQLRLVARRHRRTHAQATGSLTGPVDGTAGPTNTPDFPSS